MGTKKNIVILGAGYGGVHAAKVLSKKLKKNDDISITLIDKNPYHTLMTELHEVAGGRVDPESVQVDLRTIFGKSKVNVLTEEITNLNFNEKKVTSEHGEYSYDYLILGTGSEPAYFGVPGVKENGFSLWSLDDAVKIREHIENMFKKACKERNANRRKEMLTFIVAGAGFTGIETIGEFVELKKQLCKKYNVEETEVKLMVVEALDRILNILNDGLADKAERYLAKHNVEILKSAPITQVNPNSIVLKNGTEIPTRTLIWTCGIQGNNFCANLGLSLTNRCRLFTNDFMQIEGKEEVYVVGDAAFLEEGSAKSLPQIVEAAVQTADTVAKNIVADIEDKEKKAYKSNYHGFMVSIGSHYCVASFGGTSLSGFVAMAIKHLVNLHYLFGIGGFYLIWKYLCHEFFQRRDRRSMVGGFLSSKGNRLWLVPLRLFVGVNWIIEGINKIKEGWLLADHIVIVKVAGVAGASEAAGAAGDAAGAAAAPAVVPLISQPPAIYTWFADRFIAPIAHYVQIVIVCTEIAIGLALIVGLFTFLASLVSIALGSGIIMSAMAGKEILWFMIAAIALMGGAGRTLGLDYWVMPWIKDWLGKFWFGKRKPAYVGIK